MVRRWGLVRVEQLYDASYARTRGPAAGIDRQGLGWRELTCDSLIGALATRYATNVVAHHQ